MSTQVVAPDMPEADFDRFREHTCAHCDRALTQADVRAALKRNPESVPGKVCCRRRECREEYKSRVENEPALDAALHDAISSAIHDIASSILQRNDLVRMVSTSWSSRPNCIQQRVWYALWNNKSLSPVA